MARNVVDELVVRLTADATALKNELNRAEATSKRAATNIGTSFAQGFRDAARFGAVAAASVTAVAGALTAAANKAAAYADEIDKAALRTRLSRGAVQELRFVTDQLGGSFATIETAVVGLTQRLAGVEQGSERQTAAFQRLGVSIKDASGNLRSTEDILFDSIAALQGVTNETERAVLAQEVFGRSAAQLGPILAAGAGSVDDLRKKARDLGIVLDDQSIGSLVRYKDEMSALSQQFGAVGREITLQFLPVLTEGVIPAVQKALEIFQKLPEPMQKFGAAATGIGVGLTGAAAGARLLGVSLAPLIGPTGAIILGSIALAGFADALIKAKDPANIMRGEIDLLAEAYQKYRGEIVVTTQEERDAAVARLQTTRGELQARLSLLRELAESQRSTVQAFIDSPLGRFLLPGFINVQGGANQSTLAEIERASAVIANIEGDINRLLGGDNRLVPLVAPGGGAPGVTTPAPGGAGGVPPVVLADPAAQAKAWTSRLLEEVRLGLKTEQEVFDILAPNFEWLKSQARDALRDFGFDSTQFQDVLAKLNVVESALNRVAAGAAIPLTVDRVVLGIPDAVMRGRPLTGDAARIAADTAQAQDMARTAERAERVAYWLGVAGQNAQNQAEAARIAADTAQAMAAAAEDERAARLAGWREQIAVNADLQAQAAAIRADTAQAMQDAADAPREILRPVIEVSQDAVRAFLDLTAAVDANAVAFQRAEAFAARGVLGRGLNVPVAPGAPGVAPFVPVVNPFEDPTRQRGATADGGKPAKPGFAQDIEDAARRNRAEAERAAQATKDAAERFALTVVGAGADLANAIKSGSPSGIFGALTSGIGSILALNPATALAGGLVSVIGGLFAGFLPNGRDEDAVASRAAGAAARGAPALELNFTFNQSLALASLTDPASRAALNSSATDAFDRFQRVLQTNVLPRLDRLEARA